MTDHAAEALDLLNESRRIRRRSKNPDAGGSDLRARWATQADALVSEAQVHASLATVEAVARLGLTPTTPNQEQP